MTCVNDSEAAPVLASVIQPDLIMMDALMPKLSGPKVAQIISSNPKTKHIPILYLTALMNKQEEKYSDLGDRVISKDSSWDEIFEAIHKHLLA